MELILISLSLLIGFGIGVAGALLNIHYQKKRRMESLALLVHDVAQEIKSKIIHCKVEKDGDKYFMYNYVTNEYLAHGSTYEELNKNLVERFPGKVFNVEPEAYQELKGASNTSQ